MIKFIKDVIFGEPVISVTLVSLVFTAWMGALSQLDQVVPLWLAIAAPASIAIGGFYTRANSAPDNEWVRRHAVEAEAPFVTVDETEGNFEAPALDAETTTPEAPPEAPDDGADGP